MERTFILRLDASIGTTSVDERTRDLFVDDLHRLRDASLGVQGELVQPIGQGFNNLTLTNSLGLKLSRFEADFATFDSQTASLYSGVNRATAASNMSLGLRSILAASSLPDRRIHTAELGLSRRLNAAFFLSFAGYRGTQSGGNTPDTDIWGQSLGLTISDPLGGTALQNIRLSLGVTTSQAEAPNAEVLSTTAARTERESFGITQTYGLGPNTFILVDLLFSDQGSNIPNGRVSDWTLSFSIPRRF